MTEKFPDMGLPKDLIVAIGCITLQWAFLEETLNGHLRLFLDQPAAKEHRPKHLRLPFKRRLALYKKLAPLFYQDKALEYAQLGCRLIDAMKEEREWAAHGLTAQLHDGSLFSHRADDLDTGGVDEKDRPITIERLSLAANGLEKARLCLIYAYASVARDLVPASFRRKDVR